MPGLVQTLADELIKQAKKSSELTLVGEGYRVEPFSGQDCQGSYATLHFSQGTRSSVQVVFVMQINGRIWNGQFSGLPEAWEQALTLLKSITKNG